jgi:hypothetical protein
VVHLEPLSEHISTIPHQRGFKVESLLISSKTMSNCSSLIVASDIFETINSSPSRIIWFSSKKL